MQDVIRKYRHFLLPLALVALFDLTLLAMNYVLSAQLEISSIHINIAGRQRMLSQQMSKDVLLMQYQQQQSMPLDKSIIELDEAVTLFDQTLKAFIFGGPATTADGQNIQLKPQQKTPVQHTLAQAAVIWQPLYPQLQRLTRDSTLLDETTLQIVQQNLDLLTLMNTLTNQFEQRAKQQTYLLRGLQTLFVLLILLSFTVAVYRLMRREQYYSHLMEKSSDIVVGIDAASADITFISSSVKLLLQHDENHYLGKPLTRLFDSASSSRLRNLLTGVYKRGILPYSRCDIHLIQADGNYIVAEMVMQISRSEDGKNVEISGDIRDISERKQLELSLSEMAHKDPLTGLPNRAQFRQFSEHALQHARRHNEQVSIMFIDLDNFKRVNDTYGHPIGDKLLIEVALRIQKNLRKDDSVARIGGDEFVVLVVGRQDNNALMVVAEKIISALKVTFLIEGHRCEISASVGVARYPKDGLTVDSLVKAADNAMYQVKNQGKNAVIFCTE